MSTNTQTVKFCTFKEGNISLNLNINDWMKGVLRGLADKYDVDARDLYFTQKQKIVSDDATVRDVLRNTGETIYLVKRRSSAGAAGTATENEELLPRVEENISPELRSSKQFAVRVTVCNNEMKGKVVVVENVRPGTTIDEFAERALEALNIPVGWISIVSETGTKCSGIWRRGRFERWKNSEEKYVSKLTYCGQSGLCCLVYQLITANYLSEQASSSTPSSSAPSSSSNSSNVGTEAAEQNGSQTLTLQIDYGQGNKLFIEAEKEMFVEELKKILEPEVGICADKMTLVGGGTKMDNDRKISSFGLKEEDRLCAHEEREETFQISIIGLSEKSLQMDVNSEMTIEELKERIYEHYSTHPNEQRLIFAGKQLEDYRTLSSYKIQYGSIIHLVLRLRGGGSCPSHAFVDVTNTDALVERSFSNTAPPWRIVGSGINIEGICENEGCPAFKKQVICRWGMKTFDLHGSKPFCPCCLKQIVPLKPGFYDCRWRISSVKEDGTRMQMPWKKAGNEKYTTYDEKEAGTAKFLLLQIEAFPRGRVVKHPTLPYDVAVPEVCGICHKEQDEYSVQIYKCGHSFHRNCGSDWEETVGECPICQMKMKDQPALSA
ncbi:putative ubiquitin domain containing protein [Monocercomonoides exilis]|uniref:putative ubiquitin domain containing protein n=1 Tax=Monocercomonoides exilis TaxID=2049356 RepID=UPI0035593FEC|nr:putative ubiquitin domain containing protein [Monocercomonoides exilis]|eukprot:MONOS_10800.1-p1 / transcript=MONOS_10800.1 / gene=MONOS_10800 / organism=Monocercomonoides_exilis_PA203 / gene_product=ubiquitin domain containing protein / transcript_product=ubiquitin domain containing protein / location=Mono_scaffold00506:3132-5010(+) / protein_length=605 / sequence_SO=supercontig / SO=protein_coding / is_pseudo=false